MRCKIPTLVCNHNGSTSRLEHLTLNLTPSKKLVRKDSMEGRDYTVVPMVMMKEGVLNGSMGSLFYPANEISKLPVVWNGKPVVVYHPQINGLGVTACSPEIFTSQKIGVIMNTHFDETNNSLKAEAWIDEERCKKIDRRVWKAIENERMMELSTGLFTENEAVENGKHGDKSYNFIARNYKPDHLAVLPDQIGACSTKDGAGFIRNELWAGNRMVRNSISFDDIRQQLSHLIRAKYQRKGDNGIENYCYPETVYDDYVVFSNGNKTMGQPYTISKNGEVSLTGSATEVRRKVVYVDSAGKSVVGNVADFSRKEKVCILINSGVFLKKDLDWLLEMPKKNLNTIFLSNYGTAGRDGDGDGIKDEGKKKKVFDIAAMDKARRKKNAMMRAQKGRWDDSMHGPKSANNAKRSKIEVKRQRTYTKMKNRHNRWMSYRGVSNYGTPGRDGDGDGIKGEGKKGGGSGRFYKKTQGKRGSHQKKRFSKPSPEEKAAFKEADKYKHWHSLSPGSPERRKTLAKWKAAYDTGDRLMRMRTDKKYRKIIKSEHHQKMADYHSIEATRASEDKFERMRRKMYPGTYHKET